MSSVSETLVRGAWFSFEHAGITVGAAVRLVDAGDHAPAVVLAMQVIEHVGKGMALLDLRRGLTGVEDVAWLGKKLSKLEDHATLQREGLVEASFELNAEQGMGAVLAKGGTHRDLRDSIKRRLKAIPHARHGRRMMAQYVELRDGTWRRPVIEITAETARRDVDDAVAAYAFAWDSVQAEMMDESDPCRAEILTWAERPTLPPYTWPKLGTFSSGK